jgi:hypothetical protein
MDGFLHNDKLDLKLAHTLQSRKQPLFTILFKPQNYGVQTRSSQRVLYIPQTK